MYINLKFNSHSYLNTTDTTLTFNLHPYQLKVDSVNQNQRKITFNFKQGDSRSVIITGPPLPPCGTYHIYDIYTTHVFSPAKYRVLVVQLYHYANVASEPFSHEISSRQELIKPKQDHVIVLKEKNTPKPFFIKNLKPFGKIPSKIDVKLSGDGTARFSFLDGTSNVMNTISAEYVVLPPVESCYFVKDVYAFETFRGTPHLTWYVVVDNLLDMQNIVCPYQKYDPLTRIRMNMRYQKASYLIDSESPQEGFYIPDDIAKLPSGSSTIEILATNYTELTVENFLGQPPSYFKELAPFITDRLYQFSQGLGLSQPEVDEMLKGEIIHSHESSEIILNEWYREFKKNNPDEVESMLKVVLSDVGLKDKLYLVE